MTVIPTPFRVFMHEAPTQTKVTARLHEATMAMMSCQRLGELLERVVASVLALSNAEVAVVLLAHETGEHLDCVAAGGALPGRVIGTRRVAGEGLSGASWSSGEARFVVDVDSQAGCQDWPEPMQGYVHPLGPGPFSHGVIAVYAKASGIGLREDIDTLARLSELAGVAIHNVRSAESVSTALRRTHALGEVSRQLFELNNATDACDAACRMLLSAADIDRASSFLIDADGLLRPHVSWHMSDAGIQPDKPIPPELVRVSIAQRALDSGGTVSVSRADRHAPQSKRLDAILRRRNIGSAMAIPLVKAGTPIGAMVVTRQRTRRDLSESEIDVCMTVVHQLSTALERSDLAQELQHRAWHDGLTGLPNRSRFEARLDEQLRKDSPSGAVLFIDLDGFKRVNDSLGHALGDALLVHVARRLQSKIKQADLLARMGGDEFAILLCDVEVAQQVGERVLAALTTPFDIDGENVTIGASLGLCSFPDDGDSIDTLLRHADVAMYEAKHARGGGMVRFSEELMRAASESERLEEAMRYALADGGFELAYQPQVDCITGEVVGMEALIRWHHPERGLIPPDEFIPVAETSGLIDRIGDWVIEQAALRLAEWRDTPLGGRRLSINIAASQFQQEDFVESLLATLTRLRAPAHLLELELTETLVMRDVSTVALRLQQLRAAGLRIAIDDFGTGYSSLSYLQDLPLDVLKIDRAFVTRLQDDGGNEHSLVNTILLLSAGLGLESVAEGVETPGQQRAVARLGCNLVQGYLHSRPVFEHELAGTVQRIESDTGYARRRVA